MNIVCGAMSYRLMPHCDSASWRRCSITWPMWSTSSRVPWKALLAVVALSTSQIGRMPRSRADSALSTTTDAARHADDHAVPPPVEGQGGLLDDVVGGGRAGDEEARGRPLEERVAGEVVGGDDDDAPAAAGADPVLRQGDALRGAGARRVDVRVRAARADELGELRVPHRQDLEDEAAVEGVAVLLDGRLQLVDAMVDVGEHRVVAVAAARVSRDRSCSSVSSCSRRARSVK